MSRNPPKEVVSFAFRHPDTGRINKPQCSFHDTVMRAVASLNLFRFFFYGGAIRGGKTYVCLFILVQLARLFPRSRWHIFRSDFPELEDTTIPSMEKLIGTEGKDFVWKRKSSNYHVLFSNGSKIFFKSENLMKDPDLKWMLGLETNGIVLEQMEGLSLKLFQRAIERLGSWYIPNMPPPLLLGTFNPTSEWVKKEIYDRHVDGDLPLTWFYQEALPEDNPYVTQDQWDNWENLDPISRDQLIRGIWKFMNDAKLFAYSFSEKKHVVDVNTPAGKEIMTAKKGLPVKLIFDFNVDPITCLVAQNDGLKWIRILKEYRLRNSDIFELCERVHNDWGDYFCVATGDASGRNRSALTKGNRTYVQTIQKLLHLSPRQMQFPATNPSIANTRMLMNSLFFKHPDLLISSDCQFFIDDLRTVKIKEQQDKSIGIEKSKDPLKTHLLDNGRYYFWNYLRKFINM